MIGGNDKFVSVQHVAEILTFVFRYSTVSVWVSGIAHSTCAWGDVIHNLTFGILATTSTARILTFVTNTCFVRWTVRVQNAFRATSFIRIAVILGQTLARADAILLSAIGIRTARIRNTRCGLFIDRISLDCTQGEWIANISSRADAHRCVTNHATLGILCARIWTRIFAFIVYASKIAGAFRIWNAFGTTVWCRANKTGQTRTRWWISNGSTFSIWSTGRRLARIYWILDWLLNYASGRQENLLVLFQRTDWTDILIGWHITNGFPVYRFGQLQIGLWFTTIHFAPIPQVPTQGSRHFWFEHASVNGQSEFTVHSGRHVGGLPI